MYLESANPNELIGTGCCIRGAVCSVLRLRDAIINTKTQPDITRHKSILTIIVNMIIATIVSVDKPGPGGLLPTEELEVGVKDVLLDGVLVLDSDLLLVGVLVGDLV